VSFFVGVFDKWAKNHFWYKVLPCIVGTVVPIYLEIRVSAPVVGIKTLCPVVLTTYDDKEYFHAPLFLPWRTELAANTLWEFLVHALTYSIRLFTSSELVHSWCGLTMAGTTTSLPDSCCCSSSYMSSSVHQSSATLATSFAVFRMFDKTAKQPNKFSYKKWLYSTHCLNDHDLNTCTTVSPIYRQ